MMKTKPYIKIVLASLVVASIGCLEFGTDEETTTPTEDQVSRCRTEMYLNDAAEITPLGFKLLGSGIDDVIWFKFEADADDLSQVFDTSVVNTDEFEKNVMYKMEDVEWWDVEGKELVGGEISLPNARFMNLGAEKIEGGYIVYIMWHET
jgi:hypothetical protein